MHNASPCTLPLWLTLIYSTNLEHRHYATMLIEIGRWCSDGLPSRRLSYNSVGLNFQIVCWNWKSQNIISCWLWNSNSVYGLLEESIRPVLCTCLTFLRWKFISVKCYSVEKRINCKLNLHVSIHNAKFCTQMVK